MDWLVICHYKEPNMEWLGRVNHQKWNVRVDARGEDERRNTPGREATTYLQFICDRYDRLEGDSVVFAQANPFHHCPDFLELLDNERYLYFGPIHSCGPNGLPAVDWTRLHDYCEVLGLPKKKQYLFVAGAQFRVDAKTILARPKEFYLALLNLSKLGTWETNKIAWVLERLWPDIFPTILSALS